MARRRLCRLKRCRHRVDAAERAQGLTSRSDEEAIRTAEGGSKRPTQRKLGETDSHGGSLWPGSAARARRRLSPAAETPAQRVRRSDVGMRQRRQEHVCERRASRRASQCTAEGASRSIWRASRMHYAEAEERATRTAAHGTRDTQYGKCSQPETRTGCSCSGYLLLPVIDSSACTRNTQSQNRVRDINSHAGAPSRPRHRSQWRMESDKERAAAAAFSSGRRARRLKDRSAQHAK